MLLATQMLFTILQQMLLAFFQILFIMHYEKYLNNHRHNPAPKFSSKFSSQPRSQVLTQVLTITPRQTPLPSSHHNPAPNTAHNFSPYFSPLPLSQAQALHFILSYLFLFHSIYFQYFL